MRHFMNYSELPPNGHYYFIWARIMMFCYWYFYKKSIDNNDFAELVLKIKASIVNLDNEILETAERIRVYKRDIIFYIVQSGILSKEEFTTLCEKNNITIYTNHANSLYAQYEQIYRASDLICNWAKYILYRPNKGLLIPKLKSEFDLCINNIK